jgi:hypothetical protein
MAAESLRIDSIKAAWIALQYAKANDLNVAFLNYALRSSGPGSGPFWRVECFNSRGQLLSSILVAADEGNVLARSGLPKEPNLPSIPKTKPPPEWRTPRERAPVPDRNEVRRMARQGRMEEPPEDVEDARGSADPWDRDQYRTPERLSRRPRPFSLERIVRSILPF